MPSPIVEIIEPTVTVTQSSIGTILPKKRVAAYARVSTAQDEQQSSYGNQVDYYNKYIRSKSEWEYVGIYTDACVIITLNQQTLVAQAVELI